MSRRITLVVALVVVVAAAGVGWWAGTQIKSPAQLAVEAEPPEPSLITVEVARTVISNDVITRGTVRFDEPVKVTAPSLAVSDMASVVTWAPNVGDELEEGSVLFEIAGRPTFALQGELPLFRTVKPDDTGEDIEQLQTALERLGFDPGEIDGKYSRSTEKAVKEFYESRDHEPIPPTEALLNKVAAAKEAVASAKETYDAAVKRRADATAAEKVEAAKKKDRDTEKKALTAAEKRQRQAETKAQEAETKAQEAETKAQQAETKAQQAEAKAQEAEAKAKAATQPGTTQPGTTQPGTTQPGTAQPGTDSGSAAAGSQTDADADALKEAADDAREEADDARKEADDARKEADDARKAVTDARKAVTDAREAVADAQTRVGEVESAYQEASGKVGELGAPRDVDAEKKALDKAQESLAELQAQVGTSVPSGEFMFFKAFPIRVDVVNTKRGGLASGELMTVSGSRLAVDSSVSVEEAELLNEGDPVTIELSRIDVEVGGTISKIADRPGTNDVAAHEVYIEILPDEIRSELNNANVKITIPVAARSTEGDVLAVPVSALSATAGGDTIVTVEAADKTVRTVKVKPGLTASGLVEVTPTEGELREGERVVVGFQQGSEGATTTTEAEQ